MEAQENVSWTSSSIIVLQHIFNLCILSSSIESLQPPYMFYFQVTDPIDFPLYKTIVSEWWLTKRSSMIKFPEVLSLSFYLCIYYSVAYSYKIKSYVAFILLL